MTGKLLMRGMIVGALAGLLAFFFAYTFGEPQVDLAIAFEEQQAAAEATTAPAEEEEELVSRATQATWGLITGMVGYGAAIGGIFSLVFAFAHGRLGQISARTTSALLAAAAFVSIVLVPLVKYPANPPAVGSDDSIAARTTLFFIILLISVGVMVATFMLARNLWARHGGWTASIAALMFFLVATAIVYMALPPIVEMPDGFDPSVLWNFRVSSLGIHLLIWTVIGLGFGPVAERLLDGRTGRV